ncbi:DNA-processing protein DprA [Microbacterium sp. P04]|uniref:DNA-processing protein DprA n=1 Tax=Microbacterium sp. P04 TaxID=3366947 RepID=UPI00374692E1
MTRIEVSMSAARIAVRGLHGASDDERMLETFARAAWSVLIEPGDSTAGRLIAAVGPIEALGRAIVGDTSALADLTEADLVTAMARWRPRCEAEGVAAAVNAARATGARLVVPGDRDWPGRLDDLGVHAPVVLWARGDLGCLAEDRPAVAIVGARAATGYGELVAAEFGAQLAAAGITIVSGAAYGIDGSAHRAALSAGGHTVALLAGGVDPPYPSGHAALIDAIAASGALLAETPCGSAPTKWRFLARNRLIAALSDATVVVEAGARSGSLNTAAHAAALGRALGAVPGAITSAASAGCHRIIREFDGVCVTSADEVKELMGWSAPRAAARDEDRTDDLSRVLDALSARVSRSIADLSRVSGLAETDVEAYIALAQLAGEAEERSDGWRRRLTAR